jgi:hypothetical protein
MKNVKQFPSVFYELNVDIHLKDAEIKKIREGKLPSHQDDRWIIYFEDPWLYFHRSWTTFCIYKVHVNYKAPYYFIDKVLVNGENEQYKSNKLNELSSFMELFYLFLNSEI